MRYSQPGPWKCQQREEPPCGLESPGSLPERAGGERKGEGSSMQVRSRWDLESVLDGSEQERTAAGGR